MNPRPQQNYAALTDVGRVRTHNEDSILAQPPLFVVADGLGGHEAGEVASSIAVETVRDHAPRRADAKAIGRAVRAANREVLKAAREGIGRQGMGTTLTAAIIEGHKVAIAHVGDSRAYLLHDGELARVTQDHSLVADLVRRGQITEEESRHHPNRSIITRALGTDSNMEADAFEFMAAPGDRLLLCSDGLTGMLEDARIAETLQTYIDPQEAGRILIQAANDAGGQDNISVIIVDIDTETAEAEAAAAEKHRNTNWRAIGLWVAAFLLVILGVGYGTYRYARGHYYLIDEKGVIVVYQGVPGSLAGYSLHWKADETTVPVQPLSTGTQIKLEGGIQVDSLAKAKALVDEYRVLATPPATGTPPSTASTPTGGQ